MPRFAACPEPAKHVLDRPKGLLYPPRSMPSRFIVRREAACRRASSDCAKLCDSRAPAMCLFRLVDHAQGIHSSPSLS